MASALLQNSFLEDVLALPCLYHAVHLISRSLGSSDSVHSPFHNFPVTCNSPMREMDRKQTAFPPTAAIESLHLACQHL